MEVLVLGGTGAMGVHLVRMLSENCIETTVTSRRSIENSEYVRYIQGDAKNIEFLQILLSEDWDVIVDFMVYSTSTFEQRVKTLLASTSQYLFLSSSRVYADSKKAIKESSPRLLNVIEDEKYLSTDEYALTKARQEDILKKSGKFNWTIIRPYITYSEIRLQLGVLEKEEWLYRALQGKTIVFSNDVFTKKTTLTYGLDVSKGIMATIGNSEALGQFFHITGDESYKWSEILSCYLDVLEKHLGYRPKYLLQNSDKILDVKSAKYQVKYDRLYNRSFNNLKIKQYLNTETFTKTRDGLVKCLEEFLKTSEFKPINWRNEALKDRQTKEFTKLKEIPKIKQKVKYIIYRYSPFVYKS
jgi:nucleoside-diphosphate-sugar epimerase